MVACGKTRPSIEMTEQARLYLNTMKPRSLDLWFCASFSFAAVNFEFRSKKNIIVKVSPICFHICENRQRSDRFFTLGKRRTERSSMRRFMGQKRKKSLWSWFSMPLSVEADFISFASLTNFACPPIMQPLCYVGQLSMAWSVDVVLGFVLFEIKKFNVVW